LVGDELPARTRLRLKDKPTRRSGKDALSGAAAVAASSARSSSSRKSLSGKDGGHDGGSDSDDGRESVASSVASSTGGGPMSPANGTAAAASARSFGSDVIDQVCISSSPVFCTLPA